MAFSFGAPTSAPPTPTFSLGLGTGTTPFGGTASPFGAAAPRPPSTGFSFGATPSPTPTLFGGQSAFGAPSTSAAPAFSFGNTTQQAKPSIFGGTNPTTFGFGQTASAQSTPAFSFSSFGAGTAAAQNSIFGTPQQQPAPSPFTGGLPPQPAADLTAVRELEALRDAFYAYPGNRLCIFNHFFLNVVENPAARVKPDGVNELKWREALQRAGGPDNAEQLYPVQANGFKDLLLRKNAQDEAIREHQERVQNAVQLVRQLERKQETVIKDRTEKVERTQRELRSMLLKCIRYIDVLESRFASAIGYYPSDQCKQRVDKISKEISSLESEVSSTGLRETVRRRLEKLQAAIRLRGGASVASGSIHQVAVSDDDLQKIFEILSETAAAAEKFQAMLDDVGRDVMVLKTGKS
eukprot:jgi/Botrbrau1/20178/Bobra.0173s0076.1